MLARKHGKYLKHEYQATLSMYAYSQLSLSEKGDHIYIYTLRQCAYKRQPIRITSVGSTAMEREIIIGMKDQRTNNNGFERRNKEGRTIILEHNGLHEIKKDASVSIRRGESGRNWNNVWLGEQPKRRESGKAIAEEEKKKKRKKTAEKKEIKWRLFG